MRRRRRDGSHGTALFWTTGWLFADLLLALAMGFLVANTVGQNPPPLPTATPAPPTPTPTPHQITVLERDPVKLSITLLGGYQQLLNGNPQTISDAQNQLQNNPGLQGHRAGLVLTFGGGGPGGSADLGNQIASQFIQVVLKQMHVVFDSNTVYHDPFHDLYGDPNVVELEIYLFKTVNDQQSA